MGKRPNEEYLDIANTVRRGGIPKTAEEISIQFEISTARAKYILKHYLDDFQPAVKEAPQPQHQKGMMWGQSKDDYFYEKPSGSNE